MSGGSLDYSYSKINEVIEKLQERLELENDYYVWAKPKISELIESLEIISNKLWQLEWIWMVIFHQNKWTWIGNS